MLEPPSLKDYLHDPKLTRLDKLLLLLVGGDEISKAIKDIKLLGKSAGLRQIGKWNVSQILGRSKGLAIRTDDGWEITNSGRLYLAELGIGPEPSEAAKVSTDLRGYLSTIADETTQSFVLETIKCYENKLYRAAVVLSWVGAISILYHHVVENDLAAFNIEATSRNAKWRRAKTIDDLARMKESDFLDILVAVSVIGKSVKDELAGCLKRRNGCGHPNSMKLGRSTVAHHIETLMLNVFSKFT